MHDMTKPLQLRGNVFDVKYEPLAGANVTNLFRLYAQNRFLISLQYMPRMLYATVLSNIITPFRIKEKLKFDKSIKQTEIIHSPLFIIGHWRSGTTYIHNMLSLDTTFGYCSTFTATVPGVFLGSEKIFKPVLAASITDTRPMDNVPMGTDLPQEEEYAIGDLIPYAYYNGWCFPKNMDFYNNFVCMENVSKYVIDEWKETYLYFLKKLTYYRDGKRLILKNPAHTARVKLLLEMFPDAQFINIYRNPYDLYYSMMKFLRIVVPIYCLQKSDMQIIEGHMLDLYVKMYKKYFEERRLIPEGNLVEIKYEDFIQHPFENVEKIYATLRLKDFKATRKNFHDYATSQKFFKTSNYTIEPAIRDKINNKWNFVFDKFGYEM